MNILPKTVIKALKDGGYIRRGAYCGYRLRDASGETLRDVRPGVVRRAVESRELEYHADWQNGRVADTWTLRQTEA